MRREPKTADSNSAEAEKDSSIQRNSKSFALASLLIPSGAREDTHAVYAWCRRADDAVDEGPSARRPGLLAQLQAELSAIYGVGNVSNPVAARFQHTVRSRAIPQLYPRELLAGMEMDLSGRAYDTWDTLQLYCYRVASTVGLMMCHVLGVKDDAAPTHAAQLGLALQLTNICRDVHEDWTRGRLYLPDELLASCGARDLRADLGKPLPPSAAPPLRRAVREVLQVAGRHYRAAEAGFGYLPLRSALAVASARWIYAEIGVALARTDYDVFAPRVVVSSWRKLALMGKATAWTLWQRRSSPFWSGQRRSVAPSAGPRLMEVPYAPSLFAV